MFDPIYTDLIKTGDFNNNLFDLLLNDFDALFTLPNKKIVDYMDIIESEDSINLTLDIPGLTKDEIKITKSDNLLNIKASRTINKDSHGRYGRKNIMIDHTIRINNMGNIKAQCLDGVLNITVSKAIPKMNTQEIIVT